MTSFMFLYVAIVMLVAVPIIILVWSNSLTEGIIVCLAMLMTPVAIWFVDIVWNNRLDLDTETIQTPEKPDTKKRYLKYKT